MWRRLSMCVVVLLIPTLGFAQVPVRFGVSLSGVSSDMHTGAEVDFFQSYSGLSAGVFSEFEMTSWLAIGVGAEWVQAGFTEEQGESTDDASGVNIVEATSRLNYFSVPLYVKINVLENKFTPYVLGGMRLNWLMSHRAGVAEFKEYPDYVSPYSAMVKDENKSWMVGVGVSTQIAEVFRLDIQLTHSRDLDDVLVTGDANFGDGRNHISALSLRFAK